MRQYWIGLDWIGLGWVGLDWAGLDWIGLDELRLYCYRSLLLITRDLGRLWDAKVLQLIPGHYQLPDANQTLSKSHTLPLIDAR